ncbi:MAG TPA: hypothetical protein VG496_07895 [Myxococcales bacterium]|nr:hypothetical protein [Myxococcales bacterium]
MANIAALWSAKYLPFTDLPQHAAAIATIRHWNDPAWKAREYFTLALGRSPYLLYYLAGALLAFPLGSAERANLVLLSLIALAFPFALRSLLRAMRGDERLALFANPLFWSQSLLIGFFNYLAALPVMLWGLALAVRDAQDPRPRRTALLAITAIAIFYLHLSAFLLFVPAALLASLVFGRKLRAIWWAAPVALLGIVFLATSPVVHPAQVGWQAPLTTVFEPPGEALSNLPAALLDIWPGAKDEAVLLALILAAVLLAWPQPREADDNWSRRSVAGIWCAMAALLYFAFPLAIGWLWQLNERYAIAFALLAPLLLRPMRGLRGAAPLLLVAAAGFFSAGTASQHIRGFTTEVDGFDGVLDAAAPGGRLIGLMYERGSAFAKFSPYLQFAAYYRARKGGVASFSFAELPQSPLRYRPENAPPPHPPRWEWEPWRFRNATDGAYYDYVLLRGSVHPFQPGGTPVWNVVAHSGAWTLFAKQP